MSGARLDIVFGDKSLIPWTDGANGELGSVSLHRNAGATERNSELTIVLHARPQYVSGLLKKASARAAAPRSFYPITLRIQSANCETKLNNFETCVNFGAISGSYIIFSHARVK